MYDRMQEYSTQELTRLHEASAEVLRDVGVAFNDPEALEIFRHHGVRVEGKVAHPSEGDVERALRTAPSRIRIEARDPAKSVEFGGDDFVFAPGYGVPFVTLPTGERREATMDDYDDFCRLVQTSRHLDMNGYLMVQPSDLPAETAHLDMLVSNLRLCDKPFMGSPVSRQGAVDSLELAGIAWGSKESLRNRPVMNSIINSLSPLQFSEEMTGALIEFARHGQPVIVVPAAMAGSTAPVKLGGLLVLQNAEILAGVVLTQLLNPGTPVLYGSASSVMDMRTGGFAIGAPELPAVISATAQMARFYGLPSRSGGALTDSLAPDMQAASESTLALVTAVRSGINYILHACGILGSFMSMCFEKFVLDEELCARLRRMIRPVDLSDEAIDLATLKAVGVGGEFLTQKKTFALCRTEFFAPEISSRQGYDAWAAQGMPTLLDRATERVRHRLAAYEPPDLDPSTDRDLDAYVRRRKGA